MWKTTYEFVTGIVNNERGLPSSAAAQLSYHNQYHVREVAIWFFMTNEVLSILENMILAGVPFQKRNCLGTLRRSMITIPAHLNNDATSMPHGLCAERFFLISVYEISICAIII